METQTTKTETGRSVSDRQWFQDRDEIVALTEWYFSYIPDGPTPALLAYVYDEPWKWQWDYDTFCKETNRPTYSP